VVDVSGRVLPAAAASVLAGILGASLLALGADATLRDTLVIIGLALGGSAVAALLAVTCLRALRARSLGLHVAVVALSATVTMAAGVALAAWAMFLSGHDAAVLEMVLVVSSGMAAALGIATGAWYGRQLAAVERLAAGLADGTTAVPEPDGSHVAEINQLHRRLVDSADALAVARARQASLERSRREFVAWASHDLRSPIAAIRAMAESLEDGVVDDPADRAHCYRAIRDESLRLGGLVDDLFELSRLESGTPPSDHALAPAGALVAEVVDAIQPAAAAGAINVVNLVSAQDAAVPAADMRRTLRNLLDNAVRHTRTGGSVVIDGDVVDDTLRLSVTDECGGIPPEEIGRVFDVAFRGDTARRRDTAGGGLGLTIAKGLVERHGGRISVANRGGGCRFSIALPVPASGPLTGQPSVAELAD
jgi:signal transduction histidine kinase